MKYKILVYCLLPLKTSIIIIAQLRKTKQPINSSETWYVSYTITFYYLFRNDHFSDIVFCIFYRFLDLQIKLLNILSVLLCCALHPPEGYSCAHGMVSDITFSFSEHTFLDFSFLFCCRILLVWLIFLASEILILFCGRGTVHYDKMVIFFKISYIA